MGFKPIRKNVLIAQIKRKTTTESGIIIEGVKSVADTETARVLGIGDEVTMVQVGDELLVDWSKTGVITLDGEQRCVIDEINIIAVLDRV
jgi:co-chaperonin GroES (HSP10)